MGIILMPTYTNWCWLPKNNSYHQGPLVGVSLASESHWLQPVLVLTVRWWPAPINVGGLLLSPNQQFGRLANICSKDLIG